MFQYCCYIPFQHETGCIRYIDKLKSAWWFDLRVEPILCNDWVTPKRVDWSGQKWQKNNKLSCNVYTKDMIQSEQSYVFYSLAQACTTYGRGPNVARGSFNLARKAPNFVYVASFFDKNTLNVFQQINFGPWIRQKKLWHPWDLSCAPLV